MSELDSCMKFTQEVQATDYILKENGYDQFTIKQIRINPKTLGDIIGSSSILNYMRAMDINQEGLSRICGFDVMDDTSVPENEYYYVVKRK